MNVHMSRLYARARMYMPARTDLVWCIEDDVEPDARALFNLCVTLFQNPQAGMIAGCLRSRFARERLIAWRSIGPGGPDDAGYITKPPAPGETVEIVATGFFCTLFPMEIWNRIVFRPGCKEMQHYYYDWAAAAAIRSMNQKILLTGSVRCGHWAADGTCLQP